MAKIGFTTEGLVLYTEGMIFNKEFVSSECEVDNTSFIIPLRRNKPPRGVLSCAGVTYRNASLRISFYVNENEEVRPFEGESDCYVYKLNNGKVVLSRGNNIEKYISKTKVKAPDFCCILKPNLRKYKLPGTEYMNAEIVSYENNGIVFSSEKIETIRSKSVKL